MEAVVLAGGFGTRLRQLVPDVPKPMAPVAGRPFLEILLVSLAQKGFDRVVLSLGFMADKVSGHFRARFAGMSLVYEVESKPLGTGGAIRQALTCCESDHVFVFNGDTYLDLEVAEVEALWTQNHAPIIVVREVPDAARFGRVEVSQGRMVAFAQKGGAGPGLINAGCYLLPRDIFSAGNWPEAFSIEDDFLATNVSKHRFDVFVTQGHFIDIGVPADYARAQVELAGIHV